MKTPLALRAFARLGQGAGDDWLILERSREIPDGHEPIPIFSEEAALALLRRVAGDFFDMAALRRFHDEVAIVRPLVPPADARVLAELAAWLAADRLLLLRVPARSWAAAPQVPETAPREPAPVARTGTLQLLFIDDLTDEPVPGVKLTVVLADDTEQEVTSGSDGRVDLASVAPGNVRLRSFMNDATLDTVWEFVKHGATSSAGARPQAGGARQGGGGGGRQSRGSLVKLARHQVKKGETLEVIAASANLTVEQLVHFNWPAEGAGDVQEFLSVAVGCTNKGADGKYVLDETDRPGLIYIPGMFERSWVPCDELQYLRVCDPLARGFVFSS